MKCEEEIVELSANKKRHDEIKIKQRSLIKTIRIIDQEQNLAVFQKLLNF